MTAEQLIIFLSGIVGGAFHVNVSIFFSWMERMRMPSAPFIPGAP